MASIYLAPLLLMSVISTDSEGAKRPKGSGEIPRMRPLPCRYEVFFQAASCYPFAGCAKCAFGDSLSVELPESASPCTHPRDLSTRTQSPSASSGFLVV